MPGTKRLTGEESWTKISKCQLDAKSSRALKENLDVDKGKPMELHEVSLGLHMDKVGQPLFLDQNVESKCIHRDGRH